LRKEGFVHLKKLLSLAGAIAAAAVLITSAGAGASVPRFDLSTQSGAAKYLKSIGVNPKGVVIQRGLRNYAGARCPGKGWSCTRTTHPVVQVAAAGGKNTFACSTPICAVVQVAAAPSKGNKSICIRTTGLGQSCTISQSSATGDNMAVVYENAGTKTSGLTQTALYTASITQTATGSGNNVACVDQEINIDGSTNTSGKKGMPVTVTLESRQSVTITQDSASGNNSAQQAADSSGNCTGSAVTQNQTLTSTATASGSITQNENAASNGANVTLDIEQNQGSGHGVATGTNNATFAQTNSLQAIANSPAGPISQTQSSVNGGLLGTVNQDSTGVSTATATQTETQCEDAEKSGLTSCEKADPDASQAPPSLTQIQHGPVRKGVGTATQTGNSGDLFTIIQTSNQDNDQGSGSTQTNDIQADCQTSGNCTVTQNTNINGTPSTNTQSGNNVDTETNCTGSTCTSTCNGSPCGGGGGPTACQPSSSLTVLAQGSNVSAYVPKGNWGSATTGVGVVPVEGAGAFGPALIPTPNAVNSCASNFVTGVTACTANNTDVYLLSGTSLSSTLTSGGSGSIGFSGGGCTNCGVAMDATHNKALIGLSVGGTPGFQFLDLAASTFEPAFTSPAGEISEDPLVDPFRNLLLSASENNNYEIVNIANTTSPAFFENGSIPSGGELDSSGEDCSTGIALAPAEFSSPSKVYVADLTQATFTPGAPAGTWTAPSQVQTLDESFLSAGASGIAVAQGTHVGIVSGVFGGDAITAIALPATSGSGTPAIQDWLTCSIGSGFSNGFDPHTVTAYKSPNSGDAIGLLANGGANELADVDLTKMLNPATVPRTEGGHGCASGTLPSSVLSFIAVP
jgi:hypothetical protein